MNTKLTIKLDKQVIEKAKIYASAHNRSLSKLIESYLKSLVLRDSGEEQDLEISPFVKSMSTGKSVPADLDIKEEYNLHLESRYK